MIQSLHYRKGLILAPITGSIHTRMTLEFPEIGILCFRSTAIFFGTNFEDRQIVVKEGDTLSLGKHELTFVTAPMVHWPEVIVAYDSLDKVLFTADGFGKFGALGVKEDWACEARRYYIGIVAKYCYPGNQYTEPYCGYNQQGYLLSPHYQADRHYQSNVKPKPETDGKKGFVCKVCGYIYEGDALPDDIICPLCKYGVADFEPIG